MAEIHVTNENGPALLNAIHNIGIELRCGATCYKLRRIRYGHFDTSHALVRQQWNSSCIIDNFSSCSAAVYRSTLDRMEQLTNDTYSTPLLKEDYSSWQRVAVTPNVIQSIQSLLYCCSSLYGHKYHYIISPQQTLSLLNVYLNFYSLIFHA